MKLGWADKGVKSGFLFPNDLEITDTLHMYHTGYMWQPVGLSVVTKAWSWIQSRHTAD